MKVLLTKKAEYEFNAEKMTAIPEGIFDALVDDGKTDFVVYDKIDEVVVFDNKDEYNRLKSEYNFESEKPVYVNGKGQIFRFIRKAVVVSDGATDSE